MFQKYMWVALLEDKSIIPEFNPDGSENQYKDLPREKIEFFGLQGPRSSYFIDLKNGTFQVQDGNLTTGINIQIPTGRRGPVQICTKNFDNSYYNFHQYKNAGFYVSLRGQQSHPEIEEFLLGWTAWKTIAGIGKCFVETTLHLPGSDFKRVLAGMTPGENPQPIWKNEKSHPEIKVFLRKEPNSPPAYGSPFVFHM